MRARLGNMKTGQRFNFICQPVMAEKIERIINLAGGEVLEQGKRQYGIVFSVKKL